MRVSEEVDNLTYKKLKNLLFWLALTAHLQVRASEEEFFVSLVEESQQTIRQICEDFFKEKKKEIPLLSQKICRGEITPEEAVSVLYSPAAVKEISGRVNKRLKQQYQLFFFPLDELFDSSELISSVQRKLGAVLLNIQEQKVFSQLGYMCYEKTLKILFPAVPGKGDMAAKLWSFLCESFSINHAVELEKRLTGLLAWVQTKLGCALEQELAQTVYNAWDASRKRRLTELAI